MNSVIGIDSFGGKSEGLGEGGAVGSGVGDGVQPKTFPFLHAISF